MIVELQRKRRRARRLDHVALGNLILLAVAFAAIGAAGFFIFQPWSLRL